MFLSVLGVEGRVNGVDEDGEDERQRQRREDVESPDSTLHRPEHENIPAPAHPPSDPQRTAFSTQQPRTSIPHSGRHRTGLDTAPHTSNPAPCGQLAGNSLDTRPSMSLSSKPPRCLSCSLVLRAVDPTPTRLRRMPPSRKPSHLPKWAPGQLRSTPVIPQQICYERG